MALLPLLRRDAVPVHQNRLAETREEALGAPRGDFDLVVCTACGLVFNRAFRAELLRYAAGYDNDQTASALFSSHVESRLEAMLRDGVRGCEVVEIGCGSGEFLRRLCAAGRSRGIGFDPAAPAAADMDADVRIESRDFSAGSFARPPDVIVGRHLIEHVGEPLELLRQARGALGARDRARLYLETPRIDWITSTRAFWDLFYEHASYFGDRSLPNVLAAAGFETRTLERVFGEQYLWAVASPQDGIALTSPSRDELSELERFAAHEREEREAWIDRASAWSAEGAVAIWGAGGKGSTFLHLVDPDRTRIAAVIDVHPRKQRRFVAGTGHAVIAPEAAREHDLRHILVMNPNYAGEIAARVSLLGIRAALHVVDGR